MSIREQTARISVNDLQDDHLFAFNRTLGSILTSALAQRTFAQIIDGLPTRDDIGYFPTYSKEIANNPTSSPGAMEAAKELQQRFNTYISQVNAKVNPGFFHLQHWNLTDQVVSPSLPGCCTRVSRILYAVIGDDSCCLP